MGRWRPPRKPGSPYITAEGLLGLQTELDQLWLRRREVVSALSAAAAEGDRSENAEYIYRKKELGGIDRRIRYLQKRIPTLEVIRQQSVRDRVYFGACVEVRIDTGARIRYRLVGEDEADATNGDINIDSPIAQSLLGKQIGDEVEIHTSEKTSTMRVESIDYDIDSD